MLAFATQFIQIDQLLEHGTENIGVYPTPIKLSCFEHLLTKILGEGRKLNTFQIHTVNAPEIGIFSTDVLPFLRKGKIELRITHHLKKLGEFIRQRFCSRMTQHPVLESVIRPHVCVITEEQKQQTDEQRRSSTRVTSRV